MVAGLPEGALVTADAGFVGYETWTAILGGGRHLLVRVGANVCLLKGLGYARTRGDWVYLWPDQAAAGKPPLVLRLVVAHGGRHPVPGHLRAGGGPAHGPSGRGGVPPARGLELFYRHFKQTYDTPASCAARRPSTPNWKPPGPSGLWAMGLHAQVELCSRGAGSAGERGGGVAGLPHVAARIQERPGPRGVAGRVDTAGP